MKRKKLMFTLAGGLLACLAATSAADQIKLTGIIRDFKRGDWAGGHPDFETCYTVRGHGTYGMVPGLVTGTLGSDGKPVYNPTRPFNDSMQSASSFYSWYRDVPGVNLSMPLAITLDNGSSAPGGTYTFDNFAFFPIDRRRHEENLRTLALKPAGSASSG